MLWPLIIELSGPPRGKGAGRAAPNHRGVYQDAKTRSYEAQLRFAAQQAMEGEPPTAEAVEVEITAYVAVPSSWSKKKREAALSGALRPTVKPDCNNYSKALDALNGVVWVDDKQIVAEHVWKVYGARPGLRIVISRLWQRGNND